MLLCVDNVVRTTLFSFPYFSRVLVLRWNIALLAIVPHVGPLLRVAHLFSFIFARKKSIYISLDSHSHFPFSFYSSIHQFSFRFRSENRCQLSTIVYTEGIHHNAMKNASTHLQWTRAFGYFVGSFCRWSSFHCPIVQFNLFASIVKCQLVTQYHTYTAYTGQSLMLLSLP